MFRLIALCTALALAGTAAQADRGGRHGDHHRQHHHVDKHRGGCPPGLAKKSPACVPPGLARHADRDDWRHDRDDWRDRDRDRVVIRIGDLIDGRYALIRDPRRYGLDPDWRYYSYQDRLVRVDPDTRRIVALLGLLEQVLN